jgi:predicted transcriptional regulator
MHKIITETQVIEIRTRNASGATIRALAAEYGVSNTAIAKVTSGKSWKMVA